MSTLKHFQAPLMLSLLVIFTYWYGMDSDFTNWDDQIFISQNQKVTSFDLGAIFSSTDNFHYMPLSTLSRAVDWAISGDDAKGHHITNLLLHLLNTILVYFLMKWLLKSSHGGILVAIIFALHPMHTEVVLWLTARTYLLSSFFMLASFAVFIQSHIREDKKLYFISIGVFLLALLSSRVVVYYPLLLLASLILIEEVKPIKALKSIAPFLLLSVFFGILALKLNTHDSEADPIEFVTGLIYACYGIWFQIKQFILPAGITAFYPFPDISEGQFPLIYMLSPLVFLGISGFILYLGKKDKLWWYGYLFFLVSLGLSLKFSFLGSYGGYVTADRYSYIPYIGLGILLYLIIQKTSVLQKTPNKNALTLISILFAITLSLLSRNQSKIWHDSNTLWTDVIKKEPNRLAFNNRGNWFISNNQADEAISDFSKAILMDPNHHKAYVSRAGVYISQNQYEPALKDLNVAAQLEPANDLLYGNRGSAYMNMGKYQLALKDFTAAIGLAPEKTSHYINRANLYDWLRNPQKAVLDYEKILSIDSEHLAALSLSCLDYLELKQHAKALKNINKAIRLAPNNGEVYLYRSYCYMEMRDVSNAIKDAQRAEILGTQIDPQYVAQLKKASL